MGFPSATFFFDCAFNRYILEFETDEILHCFSFSLTKPPLKLSSAAMVDETCTSSLEYLSLSCNPALREARAEMMDLVRALCQGKWSSLSSGSCFCCILNEGFFTDRTFHRQRILQPWRTRTQALARVLRRARPLHHPCLFKQP